MNIKNRRKGLSKRCEHKGTSGELKCAHSWWMQFNWIHPITQKKDRHRYAIDDLVRDNAELKQYALHVDTKAKASAIMDRVTVAIRDGKFKDGRFLADEAKAAKTATVADVARLHALACPRAAAVLARFVAHFATCDEGRPLALAKVSTSALEGYFRAFAGERTLTAWNAGRRLVRDSRATLHGSQERSKTRTAAAVNEHIKKLRRFFNWAVQRGWLTVSPFKNERGDVLIHLMKGERKRDRTLDLATEETPLLEAAHADQHPEFYRLLVVALRTGMRRNEQLQATVGMVNFVMNRIELTSDITKTSEGRHIPILPGTDAWRVLWALCHDETGARRPTQALLHVSIDGTAIRPQSLYERLQALCKRLRIAHCTWHDLRHTWASTLYFVARVPLAVVSMLLGHKSLEQTRTYLNIKYEGVATAMQAYAAHLAANDTLAPREGAEGILAG